MSKRAWPDVPVVVDQLEWKRTLAVVAVVAVVAVDVVAVVAVDVVVVVDRAGSVATVGDERTVGAVTVTVEVARSDPDLTVTVTRPALTPRTTPVGLTLAAVEETVHVSVRPDSTLPDLSKTDAPRRTESPCGRDTSAGVTAIEAGA
jgi:hypothetical protein